MKEESTETIPCHVAGTVYQGHSEWNLLNTYTADTNCVGATNTLNIKTGAAGTYGLTVDGVDSVDLTPIYDPNHISIDIKSKKITIMDFTGQYVKYDILSMYSVFDKKFDCSKQDKHVIIAEREITVPEIKLLIKKEILTDFFDDVEEDRYGLRNTEIILYTGGQDGNNYHITISDYVLNGTSIIGITGTGGNAGIYTTSVQLMGITTCAAVIDQTAISKTVSDYQTNFNTT